MSATRAHASLPHWNETLLGEGDPDRLAQLPTLLLAWYRENARSLPWRDTPQPYRVWVSEIMLQQTRVEAVKGYYIRFLEALPTVQALAEADEDRLLKLWEGLGYYNRVRNLQRAARIICQRHGGALPASYTELLALPGIGEYTAGAIASISMGIPVPAVDGNVYRVLSRVLQSYANISLPPVRAAFRRLACELLPESSPGDFNQALMELGATVCVPAGAPQCAACPIASLCMSRGRQSALELPVKAAKKARRTEDRTVLFLICDGKVLLQRRDEKGLLSGMYQPLNLEGSLSRHQAQSLLRDMGARVRSLHTLAPSKHIFTHVQWHLTGYLAYVRPPAPPGDGLWADAGRLRNELALPSAFSAYTTDLFHWLEAP